MNDVNVTQEIFDKWCASYPVIHLVGDAPFEYITQIQQAASRFNKEKADPKNKDKPVPNVSVWCHDKASGFYAGLPSSRPQEKESNFLATALGCTMADQDNMPGGMDGIEFDPEDDIIFVFRDPEYELKEDPMSLQVLRNIIQGLMTSNQYAKEHKLSRGRRMIVLLTTAEDMEINLPEVKPQRVPLPGREALTAAYDAVITPQITSGRIPEVSDHHRKTIIESLNGFPYQDAENTLSLITVRRDGIEPEKGITDITRLTSAINREKELFAAGIPGLTLIDTDRMPKDIMPGYEEVAQLARDSEAITPEKAAKHGISADVKGIALVGGPGLGKSIFSMSLGAQFGRPVCMLSIGETQGSLVGQSEKNLRRSIQVGQRMHAIMVIDDADKALSGGRGDYNGDGGVSSRQLQMILTEMADPHNKIMWVFTFNRMLLPPELLRDGRVDYKYHVQYPDDQTRLNIMNYHLQKRSMGAHKQCLPMLAEDELTGDFSGAELESLIVKGVRHAIINDRDQLDTDFVCKEAKRITPLRRQPAYIDDIKKIESDCGTYTKVGRVPSVVKVSNTKANKRQRDIT